jgi:hypothetical protein
MAKLNIPTEYLLKPLIFLIAVFMAGCAGGGRDIGGDSGTDSNDIILGALVISGVVMGIKKYKNGLFSKTKKIEKENLYLPSASISVYEKLFYIGNEPNDFGVYTYVLFGKYPTDIHSGIYKKYEKILEIVQEKAYWKEYKKPISLDNGESSEIDTKEMNLYLLPSKEGHSKRIVSVSDYNYDFSIRLLSDYINNRISKNTNGKFLTEGPYLLSLPDTIQNNSQQYMLFSDLTGVNEELYREIFHSYENVLKTGSNAAKDPFGAIENLRIKVGHNLVKFNSVFKVIGEVYADE